MTVDDLWNDRRSFLKTIGAVGTGVSLAGCGGDGDDGGGGNGDGGDGDGGDGDGGNGGTTTGNVTEELETLNLSWAPAPWPAAIGSYMQNEGILEEELNPHGYTPEAQVTYSGPSLFASGQVDISGIGGTEAAFLASQREMDLSVVGHLYAANGIDPVIAGSQWDPDNTGSVQASLERIASEGRFGIGGWEGGDVKVFQVLFPEVFDLSFQQEDGDFTVVTSEYATLPQLIEDEEIATGDCIMSLNARPRYMSDPPTFKTLFFIPDLMTENGYNRDTFTGITTTQSFREENPEAVAAYVNAWQRGIDHFYENPVEVVSNNMDTFQVENDEQVQWLVDFALADWDQTDTPVVYEQSALDSDWISKQEDFLSGAVEYGGLSESWSDFVEYVEV